MAVRDKKCGRTHYRLGITKTAGEWESIEEVIRLNTATGNELLTIKKFVDGGVQLLCDKFNSCPQCITAAEGVKLRKNFYLKREQYETLQAIATLMQQPVSTIIDVFFFSPLLTPSLK